MNLKQMGYGSEALVQRYYQGLWYKLLKKNFTIPGGEIDLLMQKDKLLVAIEVKTVNHIDELDNYISLKKIWLLEKSLVSFLQDQGEAFEEIRMDALFVKEGEIIEIYEDITNS